MKSKHAMGRRCWAPTATQVWSDPTIRIGQNVVRSSGRERKRTIPSRKGWVTDLPEELWVCAAAEVTRRRPAAPPERARYMASQASSRRTAPSAWQVCSGAACQARGGPWQARVGLDGAGRTAVSSFEEPYRCISLRQTLYRLKSINCKPCKAANKKHLAGWWRSRG